MRHASLCWTRQAANLSNQHHSPGSLDAVPNQKGCSAVPLHPVRTSLYNRGKSTDCNIATTK